MIVGDIMTQRVVSVGPEATLSEAGELMLRYRVDALPVVGTDGRLIGILGVKDLLAAPLRAVHPSARGRYITRYFDLAAKAASLRGLRVADMMMRQVVTVTEATPLEEVVALFVNRGLHPLPVVRDGRLVGLVGRADVLRALLQLGEESPPT
jgi:CBS domain-containing protein